MLFLQAHAQVMDSTWYRPQQLINLPMPPIAGTTIYGEKIDEGFFKDQVILLAFGNLVNVASLKNIEVLNMLQKDFKGHPFKILSVIPNAKQDVLDFNSDSLNTGLAQTLRSSFHLPPMEYPVMAACDQRNPDNSLHVACDNVVKDYLIGGYPVICIVDRKGINRFVHVGLAPREQMERWYNVVAGQVGSLLKE